VQLCRPLSPDSPWICDRTHTADGLLHGNNHKVPAEIEVRKKSNNNNNNNVNFTAECLLHASYSGGPKFRPLPGNRLHWLRFVILFSLSRQMPRYMKSGHDRFHPHPFQFDALQSELPISLKKQTWQALATRCTTTEQSSSLHTSVKCQETPKKGSQLTVW